MRIIIETDEHEKTAVRAEQQPGAEETAPAAPSTELAAAGASSAGPAPSEMAANEPASFVAAPGTPETEPDGAHAAGDPLSGGAAPAFATGAVEFTEVGEVTDALGEEEG
jgi:hypothetical protein